MDALTPARALLPVWTLWANLPVAIVMGFGLGVVGTWLPSVFGLRRYRAARLAHWTERARLAWPVRTRLALSVLATPLFGLLIGAFLLSGELSPVPPAVVGLGCGAGAGFGSLLVGWRRARWFRDAAPTFADYTRGVAVEWVLRRPHILVLTLALAGMPAAVMGGDSLWATAWTGIAAVAFLAAGLASGLPLLIALRVARPVPEALRERVFGLAARMGVPLRSAWIVPWPVANALALIYLRQVVLTERLLAVLDDDEVDTVVAHELGHIGEPWTVKAGRAVVVVVVAALLVIAPLLMTAGIEVALGVFLAVIVAAVLVRRLARRMEERADKIAGEHSVDVLVYARALEKIYEANLVPAVMGSRHRAHPDLWDRMLTAGLTPDYPRPDAPAKGAARWGLLSFVLVLVCGACPVGTVGRAPLGYGSDAAYLSIALAGGHESALQNLGYEAQDEGRFDDAADLLVAAAYLSGYRDRYVRDAVEALALAGDCEEAGEMAGWVLRPELDPIDRDTMLAALRGRCPAVDLSAFTP